MERKLVWAGVAVIVLIALLAHDRGAPDRDLRQKSVVLCTILADPPKQESASLVAPARFRCEKPGANLSMTVQLQQQFSDGSWSTLATAQHNVPAAETTGGPSNTRTRAAAADCRPGKFRTLLDGVNSSNGQTEKFSMHSPSVINPCR